MKDQIAYYESLMSEFFGEGDYSNDGNDYFYSVEFQYDSGFCSHVGVFLKFGNIVQAAKDELKCNNQFVAARIIRCHAEDYDKDNGRLPIYVTVDTKGEIFKAVNPFHGIRPLETLPLNIPLPFERGDIVYVSSGRPGEPTNPRPWVFDCAAAPDASDDLILISGPARVYGDMTDGSILVEYFEGASLEYYDQRGESSGKCSDEIVSALSEYFRAGGTHTGIVFAVSCLRAVEKMRITSLRNKLRYNGERGLLPGLYPRNE